MSIIPWETPAQTLRQYGPAVAHSIFHGLHHLQLSLPQLSYLLSVGDACCHAPFPTPPHPSLPLCVCTHLHPTPSSFSSGSRSSSQVQCGELLAIPSLFQRHFTYSLITYVFNSTCKALLLLLLFLLFFFHMFFVVPVLFSPKLPRMIFLVLHPFYLSMSVVREIGYDSRKGAWFLSPPSAFPFLLLSTDVCRAYQRGLCFPLQHECPFHLLFDREKSASKEDQGNMVEITIWCIFQ